MNKSLPLRKTCIKLECHICQCCQIKVWPVVLIYWQNTTPKLIPLKRILCRRSRPIRSLNSQCRGNYLHFMSRTEEAGGALIMVVGNEFKCLRTPTLLKLDRKRLIDGDIWTRLLVGECRKRKHLLIIKEVHVTETTRAR